MMAPARRDILEAEIMALRWRTHTLPMLLWIEDRVEGAGSSAGQPACASLTAGIVR